MIHLTKKKNCKILIVEDEVLSRMACVRLLSELNKSNDSISIEMDVHNSYHSAYEKIITGSNDMELDLALLNANLKHKGGRFSAPGIELGCKIRKEAPKAKIIFLSNKASYRDLEKTFEIINPEGFWLKNEINLIPVFLKTITDVLEGNTSFGHFVSEFLRTQANSTTRLDKKDLDILFYLSEGVKNKDLQNYLPLSQSGIEKRKRKLFSILPVKSLNDEGLIKISRRKGLI